jgi:predicted nucleotidyltransferase
VTSLCYDARVGSSASLPTARLARLAAQHEGLRLLVLFGSRARGDSHARSDWDFGYLGDERVDPVTLVAALVDSLGTDRVDLTDLARAGALLRYRAAAEGHPVYAADPAAFEDFWLEAVSFWCDAAPILRTGYTDVLDRLRR